MSEQALRLHTPEPGVDATAARAVREGITVTAADIAGLPDFDRLRRWAEHEGYRALLAAPLRSGGEAIGVLVAYSARARVFTASEIELAELLAEHAAVAVSRRPVSGHPAGRARLLLDQADRLRRGSGRRTRVR